MEQILGQAHLSQIEEDPEAVLAIAFDALEKGHLDNLLDEDEEDEEDEEIGEDGENKKEAARTIP